ncbi:hypothetical protein PoB_003594100 [Plakobranchus ocellatus]|uniref:Uncharacterized protein n=1 Tax=Plakobranchus ocellatus TaxID=259542 RepID=A0AAV4AS77_9GAST|nr:hypothetical protein PoB_003594100 [Plakobranchus ocellatus]
MCRDEKLGRHILRYAKRAPVGETADVSSPDDDALLAGDYYSGTVALSHGRKERFSGAQNNGIFQSVAKARRAIDAKRKRSHTDDKRDLEYWDGPAPADINA